MKRTTTILILATFLFLPSCKYRNIPDCWGTHNPKARKEAAAREKAKNEKKLKEMMSAPVGIDVSHHQGFIEWTRVCNDRPDIQFVYVKFTEGASHFDSRAPQNFTGAHSVGYPVGGYHYFRMTSGAREQYEYFTKVFDIAIIGCRHVLIPMVDVETADGHPVQEVHDSLQMMLDLLEEHYGKKPMIYGTMRSYNALLAPDFNDYPLYIGRFGVDEPTVIDGDFTIWQFSEKGHIDGIPKYVDLCRFRSKKSIEDITLWHKKEYSSR